MVAARQYSKSQLKEETQIRISLRPPMKPLKIKMLT